MPESGPFGSVRGVCSNAHPYRDICRRVTVRSRLAKSANVSFSRARPAAKGRLRSNDLPPRTAALRATSAVRASVTDVRQSAAAQSNRINAGDRPSAGIGRCKLADRFETERSRSLSLADKALSTLRRQFACSKADLTFRG